MHYLNRIRIIALGLAVMSIAAFGCGLQGDYDTPEIFKGINEDSLTLCKDLVEAPDYIDVIPTLWIADHDVQPYFLEGLAAMVLVADQAFHTSFDQEAHMSEDNDFRAMTETLRFRSQTDALRSHTDALISHLIAYCNDAIKIAER